MLPTVEAQYDNFLADFTNKLEKIDPKLAMQTMYFERKFTDVEPNVELHIHYKKGINRDQKKDQLEAKYGFLLAKEGENEIRAVGLMTLKTIYEISNDDDVVSIGGFATCASY